MSLQGINRDAVLSAIDEMETLGRDAFLDKYGFGRARRYSIRHNDASYDSKAIVGAAHGYAFPDRGPLRSSDFTGGEGTAVRLLRSLSFEVEDRESLNLAEESPRLFILTAANADARSHLERSLKQGVELSFFSRLSDIAGDLEAHSHSGRVFAWGARPGANAEAKWTRLLPGDVCLVYSDGGFVLRGRLVAKGRSEEIAQSIWGENADGETWACMMFFDPVEEVDVSLDQVRDLLGYQSTYVPQGFDIPGEDRQARILERYGSVDDAIDALHPATGHQTVWWVSQGKTYARAREGGYLWAPKSDKAGRTHADWDALALARKDDLVLNYANGKVRAVSAVREEAFDSDRPAAEDEADWSNEGRRLNVDYRDLEPPIDLNEIPVGWRREERGGPFDQNGAVQQRYFFKLSSLFVGRLAARFPQLRLSQEPPGPTSRLTVAAVREIAESPKHRLELADSIYAAAVAALESGKHVILTGPPGTAKTTLAQALAETAVEVGQCSGYTLTTATADWTTYETIGGLRPTADGSLEFGPGIFLDSISQKKWLVIDELNRSQFDRAFGQLFTVLSGQAVTLPYARPGAESPLTLAPASHEPPSGDVLEIPKSWRIVATMNVFDKSLLFEMSYALMRRFAFVEVLSPEDEVFERLIDGWSDSSDAAAEVAKSLLAVRDVKDVGPAVYRDIARFAKHRLEEEAVDDAQVRFQAFYSYLLPQFEGISDEQGDELFSILTRRIIGASNYWRERIRDTLNEVLGLEISGPEHSDADDVADSTQLDSS